MQTYKKLQVIPKVLVNFVNEDLAFWGVVSIEGLTFNPCRTSMGNGEGPVRSTGS